jgi:hypothetical protein
MHSPLELEPEAVAAIGLINVRWAALEKGLAELLGRFLRVDHAGEAALYAITTFSQRIQLISAVAEYSIQEDLHARVVERLLSKIEDLWRQRNLYVHSHYVHRTIYSDGIEVTLVGDGGKPFDSQAIEEGPGVTKKGSFGYLKRQRNKESKFVPINRGALSNHASQIVRRGRQLMAVVKAIDTGIVTLQKDAPAKYQNISPRARLKKERMATEVSGAFTSRVYPGPPIRRKPY